MNKKPTTWAPTHWALVWFTNCEPSIFPVMLATPIIGEQLVWVWYRTSDRPEIYQDKVTKVMLGHPGQFDNTNLRPQHIFETRDAAIAELKVWETGSIRKTRDRVVRAIACANAIV